MKKRLTQFDLLKFLAMFFICLIHFFQRFYSSYSYINTIYFALPYSVALGLFFFTGGYFIKRSHTIKELLYYILKTAIIYLIPAFLFTCLSIWFLPQYEGHNFGYWMMILFRYTDSFYWYFLTACLINIPIAIFFYLSQLIWKIDLVKEKIFRGLFILLALFAYSGIFIAIYNRQFTDLGPKCLASDMLLYYAPIVLLGFGVRSFLSNLQDNHARRLTRLLLTLLTFTIWISIVIIYQNNWYEGLSSSFFAIYWRHLGTFCGVIFFYQIARYVSHFKVIIKLAKLGQYSGPFYLVHVFLIRLIYDYMTLPTSYSWYQHLLAISSSLLFFIASLSLTIVLVKIPYTDILLFGKFTRYKELPFIKQKQPS